MRGHWFSHETTKKSAQKWEKNGVSAPLGFILIELFKEKQKEGPVLIVSGLSVTFAALTTNAHRRHEQNFTGGGRE